MENDKQISWENGCTSTNFGKIKIMTCVQEDIMVEITESATKEIRELLKDREVQAIRIFLDQGG